MIRRVVRHLLRVCLRADERDAALGDLDEQYVRTTHAVGRRRADIEYLYQAAMHVPWALADRIRGMPRFGDAWRPLGDLRDSARALRRSPAFTLLAVLSLAIGIGATSTMAGVIYDVLWRPLPVERAGELVALERVNANARSTDFTYEEARRLSETAGIAAFTATRDESHVVVSAGSWSAYVVADLVDGAFFGTLGLKPRAGRFIDGTDERQSARVAVISERLWETQLGSDPGVVGSTILVRGVPFTVVGIAPAAFRGYSYPGWFSVAVPITTAPALGLGDLKTEKAPSLVVIGRLPVSGGERLAVQSAFQRCCAAPTERLSLIDISQGLGGGKNDFRGTYRTLLMTLAGGVVLFLLLACANVAVLLITRASMRAREIAMRIALGASRGRIIGRELFESALLAALGGAAGFGVVVYLRRLLPLWLPRNMSGVSDVIRFEADAIAVGGAVAISTTVVLLVGLVPAIEASRTDVITAIKSGGRGTIGSGRHGLERAGVALQISIALLLTTVGALLSTTFWRLSHVDPGLSSSPVYLAPIETRGTPLQTDGIVGAHARILESVRAIPGVTRAGVASLAPFVGGRTTTRSVVMPGSGVDSFKAVLVAASSDYFETIGIRVVGGRSFERSDDTNAGVVIVNETLADALASGEPVIGRQILVGAPGQPATIIGVVANVKMRTLRQEEALLVYAPAGASGAWPFFELAVASDRPPSDITREIRAAVAGADTGAHLQFLTTLEAEIAGSLAQERFAGVAAAVFAVVSLGLAALGLYGVMSQEVGRRTPEFGLRAALGGQRADIRRLVIRSVIAVSWVGVAIGAPSAVAVGYVLSAQLYGVRPFEPWLFAWVTTVLGSSIAAAAVIPARRASKADPLTVLRNQ